MIERAIRSRLRQRHGVSLARFDLMAQLARSPEGLTAGEAGAAMMVTASNVTGLVDRLESEGLVERNAGAPDRRTIRLTLTSLGRERFEYMAADHARWIAELLGELPATDRAALMQLLGRLRDTVASAAGESNQERTL